MKEIENLSPTLTLNNGVEMPQLGFGTYLIPNDKIIDTIGRAWELGYRNFDTAGRYKNEEYIAKAIKKYNIKRDEIFLTTKIHIDQLYFDRYHGGLLRFLNIPIHTIKSEIDKSFKKLNTEYIDLFLLHFPLPGYLDVWKVLSEYYKQGRIRAIGVCSFLPPMFDSLKDVSDVIPVVNQFEISPLNTQKRLIQYCQERDIRVQAMGTLSHWRSNMPRLEILNEPTLQMIAKHYNKSVAQIIWRWLYQQNILIIPKTWDPAHLKENIDILNYNLSSEDMAIIDAFDKGKFLNYNPHVALKDLPPKYRGWNEF